jgi:DNA-binding transcriptional regulator YiaG
MTIMKKWTLETVRQRSETEGDCWLWSQAVNSSGSPQACIEGRPGSMVAPWVLRTVLGRELLPNHVASPSCGNRRCVSLACLVERHRSEVLRIAHASGARSKAVELLAHRASKLAQRMSKLTEQDAQSIRARRHESTKALAAEFNVSTTTIRNIKNGSSWATQIPGASVFSWARAA